MRALLAVGHVLLFAPADHDAVVLRRRVVEQFHPPNWDFAQFGDLDTRKRRILCESRLHQNPQVADEHGEASQRQELGELPAGDVTFVTRKNGELVLPERLLIGAAKKRHTTPSTCSPKNRVTPRRSPPEPSCAPW